MGKYHLIFLALGIFIFAGCKAVADSVRLPYRPSSNQFAPSSEPVSIGIIRYQLSSDRELEAARRDDAYKQMYSACSGPYRIVKENMQRGGFPVRGNIQYLEYECGAAVPVTESQVAQ